MSVLLHDVQVRNSPTTFIVEFLERFTVENPQQLPVTVYDYYDPGESTLQLYEYWCRLQ